MNATDPSAPVCGARRPDRQHGLAIGSHRLPCVRDAGHQDVNHVNALGERWPVCCEGCASTVGPLATHTTFEAGRARHSRLCQWCAQQCPPEPDRIPAARPISSPVPMCIRCEGITEAVIGQVHGGAGPGWNAYACPHCAPHIPQWPDALEVLEAAQRHRRKEAEQ